MKKLTIFYAIPNRKASSILHSVADDEMASRMTRYDIIIIGAGAAGMMCAIEAGKRGRRVALIDHAKKIGGKIFISGGGRCNFTNIHTGSENYRSQNPHFCKSALSRFTPDDFLQLVRKHRIAYHEKKLGQLFCDRSAKEIVQMLVAECNSAGVEFKLDTKVHSVEKAGTSFIIQAGDEKFATSSLVIATGGLSIPKLGASGFGYGVARQFGISVIPTAPALDGFVMDEESWKPFFELAGISLDIVASCQGFSFRENILFTHVGFSGPAALQASLYWNQGDPLFIDLLPDHDAAAWLRAKRLAQPRSEIKTLLQEFFPERFAACFAAIILPLIPTAGNLSDKQIEVVARELKHWRISPLATVGYSKAEVTRGGIDTDELSSKTMEAKKIPGLFFIGEVVDVTGWLGGYNFQWAWASGWVAGQHA